MLLRRRPASARVGGVVCAAIVAVVACGGAASEPKPVPALATSPLASASFAEIRDAWRDPEHTSPEVLRAMLDRFCARFSTDGLVPLARVYLAIVALGQGDNAEADRQLAATQNLPEGSTRDLWTVASARRLRLRGNAEGGIDLLRPLVGKSVDPIARTLFQEELALAALATQRDYEAISYLDAWLRASPEDDKARTVTEVKALVEQVPKDVLVRALQAMRMQRATFGYGVDIQRILASRLAQIATETDDAELARLLLDPNAGRLVIAGDAGAQLGELATSRRGLNVVAGRTVGLLLPTGSPGLRDEAADVLRGVMWALGLPRGIRREGGEAGPAAEAHDGGASPGPESHERCAPPEPAPPLRDPQAEEALRLVTRDDSGTADRTEPSLDELAGEGAALIIAGLDPVTAGRALRWGESHGVAIVALVPPAEGVAAGGFGFVLGESQESVVEVLIRAAPSLAAERVAPVVDSSELGLYPPQGGRVGPLTLWPPTSCDVLATRPGDARFPILDWAREKTRGWFVSGAPDCARSLTSELSMARARGVVALSLEAACVPPHPAGLDVLSASAGIIPLGGRGDASDDELRGFSDSLGSPGWWAALGRDAATLARVAVDQMPADTATESRAVGDRHARARDLLTSARARLWSTEASGFTDTHTMTRTLCTIAAPSR